MVAYRISVNYLFVIAGNNIKYRTNKIGMVLLILIILCRYLPLLLTMDTHHTNEQNDEINRTISG